MPARAQSGNSHCRRHDQKPDGKLVGIHARTAHRRRHHLSNRASAKGRSAEYSEHQHLFIRYGLRGRRRCIAVVLYGSGRGALTGIVGELCKDGDRLKPQVMFHAGRMIAYFILGGVIGSLGKAFTLSPGATFAIEIFVAVVLFILGLNLLEVFAWTRRLQPSLPQFLAQHAVRALALRRSLTPFVVGAATFFLPCGFTQSIQIYALSTGSFLRGGLTMLTFALGTFPVLALASFGSSQMGRGSWAGGFFKSVGLVVIAFSLFSLVNCLVLMGIIPPVFNS